jgi:hypothetical protein
MKKLKYTKPEDSEIFKFREEQLKKKIELVDITPHLEFKLGHGGWINNFHEPKEECYHIQVYYRDENIAVFNGTSCYVIDDDKYIIFIYKKNDKRSDEHEFVIFRKVKI